MRRAPILVGLAIAAALPCTGAALRAQQAMPPLLIPGKQFGFAFEPATGVDGGVRINLIVPGSPAERAGLQIGMVVTRLNDVPLAGLDMARLRDLFLAAPDDSMLTIAGRGRIELRREPVASR